MALLPWILFPYIHPSHVLMTFPRIWHILSFNSKTIIVYIFYIILDKAFCFLTIENILIYTQPRMAFLCFFTHINAIFHSWVDNLRIF